MTQSINTSNGPYEYVPANLYRGRGALDQAVARENLLSLQRALDEREIPFGIIYGTLLGAVRDGAFIPWDEDVDVFLLDEDRQKFLDTLHQLRNDRLDLVRSDGDLYSLMRDDNYIDIYIFRRSGRLRRCNDDVIRADVLEKEEWMDFLESRFRTPFSRERFLEKVYGADWRTPKTNSPARPWPLLKHVKEWLKEKLPVLIRIKQKFRNGAM